MIADDDTREGMVAREQWEHSAVHQASTYQCAKCRRWFKTPHDLYDHLDTEHADDDANI